MKVCSCKSGCKTNRCGCKEKDSYCGPGCECNNLPLKQVEDVIDDQEESECDSDIDNSDEDGSSGSSDEEIETEIIITETVDTTSFFLDDF